MSPGQLAEARIAELGITDPSDIDVEAIAFDAQMLVEYEDLDGCEATLVGVGDRAIATVRPSGVRGRERFSVGHELGHWVMHRGRSFSCRVDDPDSNLISDKPREKEADEYAAHLLMPSTLFNPAVKSVGKPGFRELDDLSNHFETSLLATCIRLADIDTLPVVVACYSSSGLRWSKAAAHVPRRWWLHSKVDDDSFAHSLLVNGTRTASARKQPGEVWFENGDAENYEVTEECVPGKAGEVLVLLYLSSPMLDARFDPNVGVRRYNDKGSYVKRRKPPRSEKLGPIPREWQRSAVEQSRPGLPLSAKQTDTRARYMPLKGMLIPAAEPRSGCTVQTLLDHDSTSLSRMVKLANAMLRERRVRGVWIARPASTPA